MAKLLLSDKTTVVSSDLSIVTIRQMNKIGLATATDDTYTTAISNTKYTDMQIQNATHEIPISLGLGDILHVPLYYPERIEGTAGSPPPPAGLPAIPATAMLYVDGGRTDSYTADGSIGKPFTTIMAAVNQIVANGDNSSTKPYGISVVTGTYPETLDLSNPALKNLSFFGYDSIIGGASAPGTCLRIVNNDNLTNLSFYSCNFIPSGSSPHVADLETATNGSNFLSSLLFWDCSFPGGTTDFYVNCAGAIYLDKCTLSCNVNITNCYSFYLEDNTAFNQGPTWTVNTNSSGPKPNNFLGFTVGGLRQSNSRAVLVLNSSNFAIANGSAQRSPVTINSGCALRAEAGCLISGSITVNSGGEYDEYGAVHSGTLTVNAGGVYKPVGTTGAAALQVGTGAGAVQISAGTGVPNGVVVGNPGDVFLDSAGGAGNTLWVKESGVGTNTGWVGK